MIAQTHRSSTRNEAGFQEVIAGIALLFVPGAQALGVGLILHGAGTLVAEFGGPPDLALALQLTRAGLGLGAAFSTAGLSSGRPLAFAAAASREGTGSGALLALGQLSTTVADDFRAYQKTVAEQEESQEASGQPNVPDEYERALGEIFNEDVGSVEVEERSRRARFFDFFARLRGRRIVATTERNKIHLRDTAEEFFSPGNEELVLEEYFHVLRQWNTGELTTGRYIGENGIFGQNYDTNRFEVEAKDFARRNRGRLRRLLGR